MQPCSLSWAEGSACSLGPSKAVQRQSSAQCNEESSNQYRRLKKKKKKNPKTQKTRR